MADFTAVLRVGEAALELIGEFQRLQEKLGGTEARNCELDADLLDRSDKLTYYRDQRIPKLIEDNCCLRAWIDSLALVDIQIKNCEVQLAEGREKDEEVAELKKRLTESLEKETWVQSPNEALRPRMEQVESERNVVGVRVKSIDAISFELYKGHVAILEPKLPLKLISHEHDLFEVMVVKPRESRPLDEAEILFVVEVE